MDANNLRNNLIARLQEIDDVDVLISLSDFLDKHNEKGVYQLSDKQLSVLNEASLDIEQGNYVNGEEVLANIRAWLKEQ